MHHYHRHPARATRAFLRQPEDDVPQVPQDLPDSAPNLVPRAPVPSSDSNSGESSTSGEKPTSTTTTTTLPVILGAVVPIVIAIIVLIYLHRRNVRKLRSEDANDKHRSLDFGLDVVGPASKGGPMREAEEKGNPFNHNKGVSLDIGHPYLMPPGLHGSQDSFNSLSKSAGGEEDRYGHAASIMTPDGASVRSHPHASPMNYNAPSADDNARSPANHVGLHFDFAPTKSPSPSPVGNNGRHSSMRSSGSTAADLRKSKSHLASAIHRDSLASDPFRNPEEESDASSLEHPNFVIEEPAPVHLQSDPPAPSSMQTPRISLPASDGGSDYSDHRKTNATIPAVNISGAEDTESHDERPGLPAVPLPEEPLQTQNQSLDPRRDTRRMTFGLRPLPPEDPSDNPEQRANRIRSFYKEYFDESKTGRETTYIEDYGPEYYPSYPEDDTAYDPVLDDYYGPVPAPFAEPMTRRAMTPPPRAPPRFQGHMATNSTSGWSGFSGGFGSPGPRAFSSASNRLPGPQAPRKPVPPPTPLNILPTPHMLRDDSIMTAIDFAPGKNLKDQREGRPETPQGGMRPFSPMARAATPLASPFDELSAMPSPFALRKSGTFTNLDFAPPPRFKNTETASDAGSIRSNGTGGLTNTHMWNIRTGAYRVSRLPADTVGTKDDMASELRPKWDMRG